MTSDHRSALQRAVAAQQAVAEALQAEAKRIADEREQAAAGDVALHPSGDTAGPAKGA